MRESGIMSKKNRALLQIYAHLIACLHHKVVEPLIVEEKEKVCDRFSPCIKSEGVRLKVSGRGGLVT